MILADSASRKMKAEEAKQGLVIIEARYGAKDGDDMIDVTVAIQALVNDSKLTIPGGHAKVSVEPQVKLSDSPYTINVHVAEAEQFLPYAKIFTHFAVQHFRVL